MKLPWRRCGAADELAPRASEEIVLSKTTVSYPNSLSLRQRAWWLKHELPCSLVSGQMVVLIAPIASLLLLLASFASGMNIFQFWSHPSFWFLTVVVLAIVLSAASVLVLLLGCVWFINPLEFMNLVAYPDQLLLRENMLELRWSKDAHLRRLRIPWTWISSVRVMNYLCMGVIPMKVLEIEVSRIPAGKAEWQLLKMVSRDGCFFFDPEANKMAQRFTLSGIRIPLPLFGFQSDIGVLVDFVERKCGQEVVDVSARAEVTNDGASRIESFTTLWLDELNSAGPHEIERELASGTKLQGGAYTVTGVLGRGGLAVVYKAFEEHSGTSLAIKELLCNFGGSRRAVEKNLRQILSEVEILRKLDHQGIVKFRDFFCRWSEALYGNGSGRRR